MELFFVRHGEAQAYAQSDAQRRLTPRGETDVLGVVTSRRAELAEVELVVTSPYRRALQTAKIAAQALGFERELLVTEHLEPGAEPQALFDFLDTLDAKSILLVTHQPLVGNVLSLLSGDNRWRATSTANLVALQTEALVPGFADVLWSQIPA